MTQPFHFPHGRVANNVQDLLELCEQYPDDATGFLIRQDLEKWLAYIGSHDVAEFAINARQVAASDRQQLEAFLNKCHAATASKPSPEAVVESVPPAEKVVDTANAEAESPEVVTPTTQSEADTPVVETAADTQDPLPSQQVTTNTPASPNSTTQQTKPSFFQVVAKFIVGIIERN